MSEDYDIFNGNRRLVSGLAHSAICPSLTPSCRTEGELKSLIIEYHKFFYEALGVDVAFLKDYSRSKKLWDFKRAIYNYRTAVGHHDNGRAAEAYGQWYARFSTAQLAADDLARQLSDALHKLAEASTRVRKDSRATEGWRESVLMDVAAVFDEVAQCAGLKFTGSSDFSGV